LVLRTRLNSPSAAGTKEQSLRHRIMDTGARLPLSPYFSPRFALSHWKELVPPDRLFLCKAGYKRGKAIVGTVKPPSRAYSNFAASQERRPAARTPAPDTGSLTSQLPTAQNGTAAPPCSRLWHEFCCTSGIKDVNQTRKLSPVQIGSKHMTRQVNS
jgi:hypothetical protein